MPFFKARELCFLCNQNMVTRWLCDSGPAGDFSLKQGSNMASWIAVFKLNRSIIVWLIMFLIITHLAYQSESINV